MATINSKSIVDSIIAQNGAYDDDPPVIKIVQYNNSFDGGVAYGLIYEGMPLDAYAASQFIHNPLTIFERR